MTVRPLLPLFPIVLLVASLAACGGGGSSQDFSSCGNGRIDAGERCDDGNSSDSDACTTACQPARCGDGVVETGLEDCDGRNLNNGSCALVGRTGVLSCLPTCAYDYSACGELLPPTGTVTNTPTVTATASPTPTVTPTTAAACGDDLLSVSETCESCPDDCAPATCTRDGARALTTVSIALPVGVQVSQLQIELRYRTSTFALPDTGLRARFTALTGYRVNPQSNLGYAVTATVVGSTLGSILSSGNAFTVDFDECAEATGVSSTDFACVVTVCGSAGNPTPGCTCAVDLGGTAR